MIVATAVLIVGDQQQCLAGKVRLRVRAKQNAAHFANEIVGIGNGRKSRPGVFTGVLIVVWAASEEVGEILGLEDAEAGQFPCGSIGFKLRNALVRSNLTKGRLS